MNKFEVDINIDLLMDKFGLEREVVVKFVEEIVEEFGNDGLMGLLILIDNYKN